MRMQRCIRTNLFEFEESINRNDVISQLDTSFPHANHQEGIFSSLFIFCTNMLYSDGGSSFQFSKKISYFELKTVDVFSFYYLM